MDTNESFAYTVILIETNEWEIQDACQQAEEDGFQEGCSPRMGDPTSIGSESLNCLKAVLVEEVDSLRHEIISSLDAIPAEGQGEEESSSTVPSDQLQTELTESDYNNCDVSISIADPSSPSQSMLMCSEVIIGMDVDDHGQKNDLGSDQKRTETESGELPQQLPVFEAEDVTNSQADILIQDCSTSQVLPKQTNDPRSETGIKHAMKFRCSLCTKVFRSESSFLRHKNVHRLKNRRPVSEFPQSVINDIYGPRRKDCLKRTNQEEGFGWTVSLQKNSDGAEAQSKRRGCHQEDPKSLREEETSDSSTKSHSTMEDMSPSKRITESHRAECFPVDEKEQLSGDMSKPEDVHETNKTLSCGLCNEGFLSATELDTHMMIHSNFSWDESGGLTFPSSTELKRHHIHSRKQKINNAVQMVKTGFGKHNFPCNLCDKVFPRQAQLKFHLIAHSDVSCVLCDGLTFDSSEELKIHLKTHFGSKKPHKKNHGRVSCNLCNKDFARQHQLRKHMSLNSCVPDKPVRTVKPKEKALECSVSEEISKSPNELDKKNFSCSVCNNSFSHRKELEKHMLCHGYISCEGRKATRCKGHTANEEISVQSGHSKTQPSTGQNRQSKGRTKTSAASKVMPAQRQLAKKSRKHSATKQTAMTSKSVGSITEGKVFPCYVCGLEFTQPAELELHIHLHSAYSCDQCDGLTFPSSEELRTHMMNGVHAMQLKCPVCKATYASQSSLSDHIATHSDVVPRVCEFCFSTFHSVKSLKIHQIMDHANSRVYKTDEMNEN